MEAYHKVSILIKFLKGVFNQLDNGREIDWVINNNRSEFLFGNKDVSLWNFVNSIRIKVNSSLIFEEKKERSGFGKKQYKKLFEKKKKTKLQ